MLLCIVMLLWRRCFGDALDGMLRGGVSMNGAFELSRHWDGR